jgi:CHRD domain-containing protein
MKRSGVLLLCVCLLGAAGCSDDEPTNASNLPIVMTASLAPSNEVPAIANAENTGFGNVQITFNVTRDGTGAITSGTADFHFQLTGFPSSTTIIAAHIHPGAAGVNGGVIVSTGIVAGSPVTQDNGVMSFSTTGVPVPTATLQSIVNNPAGFYFNVHSPTNPGGVARGQLSRAL